MFQFWNPKTALGLSVILVRSYTSWPIFLQHFSPSNRSKDIYSGAVHNWQAPVASAGEEGRPRGPDGAGRPGGADPGPG